MKPLAGKLEDFRHDLLDPVMERFDRVDRRLGELERRVTEIQELLEVVLARAEASHERSLTVVESAARNTRRLEELEQALGRR